MRLRGKVAIVTGAGTGIGRAAARLFATEGAAVVVAEIDVHAGQETVTLIEAGGGTARFVQTDTSKMVDCQRMVRATVESYGKLNVLFNNAAVYSQGTVVDTPEEVFDRMIAVNLKGVFLCCKAAVPVMISGGGGSIVNMSSSVGWLIAAPGIVAYAASKGGVTLLTRAMALDHAKDHIRVNCICPGPTDTSMLRRAFTDEQLIAFGGTLPVSRLGRPEEIASAALWLASDEASFVTGVALPVDGGQTAQ